MSQLALPLKLDDHAVFASFLANGNEAVVDHLQRLAAEGGAGGWVWGAPSSGKTHLLQAVCAAAGDRAAYVPMALYAAADPSALDGLASREVVCIDDIERAAGAPGWERALLLLYNDILAAGGVLVTSARMAPRACPFALDDLASRMSQLPTWSVRVLGEDDRAAALRLRAAHRGLDLPDDTARYLLGRSRRDMASLYRLLDTLDTEALRAKRRLTVPFVREVLRAVGGADSA